MRSHPGHGKHSSRDGDPVQEGTTDTAGTVTSADAMVTASTADATGMADMWATSSRQDPRACPHVSLMPSATTSIKESAHSGDACASPRHIELTLHQQDSKLNLEAAGPQPNQCLKVQRRGILLCATGVSPAWAVHQTTYNPLPVVIPLCYSFCSCPVSSPADLLPTAAVHRYTISSEALYTTATIFSHGTSFHSAQLPAQRRPVPADRPIGPKPRLGGSHCLPRRRRRSRRLLHLHLNPQLKTCRLKARSPRLLRMALARLEATVRTPKRQQ